MVAWNLKKNFFSTNQPCENTISSIYEGVGRRKNLSRILKKY